MSFIAAVFLLYLSPYDAFVCLANTLTHPFFLVYYRMESQEVVSILRVLEALLTSQLPALMAHFHTLNLTLEVFAVDWFLTIFSRSFPLYLTCRVWDCFFFEGDVKLLFTVAVAIVAMHEDLLLKMDFEECVTLLAQKSSVEIDVDRLFQYVQSVRIPPKLWKSLVRYDPNEITLLPPPK
jgi:hypothetical protein